MIALFFALQIFLGRMSQKLRRAAVAVSDKRVRAMSEILTSVKMLKFYNWEESFAKKVAKVCVCVFLFCFCFYFCFCLKCMHVYMLVWCVCAIKC